MSPSKVLVDVHGLGKRYDLRTIVENVDLTLRSGDLLGLVGANGGGKTTTLRMLAGLLRPDYGYGTVLGFDIRSASPGLRSHVGYMSQRLSLYPDLSVLENLRFRADVQGVPWQKVVEELADRFDLSAIMRTRVDHLSGGWSRRVQFAALLVARPALLLLDEPTAGLDIVTRGALWRWMMDLAKDGHIVVVSTHDLVEAARCPWILHYVDGRAVGPARPADLLEAAGANSLEEALPAGAERTL